MQDLHPVVFSLGNWDGYKTSGEITDLVCTIRKGEKYLLVKANYWLKCFEDVLHANIALMNDDG